MSVSPSLDPRASGRHQRRLRNYLLDSHFQLKYTGYLVGTAILLSIALGTLLWSVSREVIAQSHQTVKQGQETVQRGQEVVRESQKVSAVVHMNIVRDPVYGSNPELAAVFNESAREQDERLVDQQQKLEADALSLLKQTQDLRRQQTYMFVVLISLLSLLVVGVGVAGIIVTHRVAGPVYKMKRLLGYVGEGHLMLTEKLRKGDELQHFFDAFEKMVDSLRTRQQSEIALLDRAIAGLEGSVADGQLVQLRALRREMQDALETSPSSSVVAA
ncbi:MAG TPA: HAMP domain-containing protein [Polyangiaceae bacterium]|jgi:nitrogen fixation/metabolism regulation signal transduction histidine kinase|nr:HAMP domain-containing protein [Polyangiaceae bacterium]